MRYKSCIKYCGYLTGNVYFTSNAKSKNKTLSLIDPSEEMLYSISMEAFGSLIGPTAIIFFGVHSNANFILNSLE